MERLTLLTKYGTSEQQYHERLSALFCNFYLEHDEAMDPDDDLSDLQCPYCGEKTLQNVWEFDGTYTHVCINGEWQEVELSSGSGDLDCIQCSRKECEFSATEDELKTLLYEHRKWCEKQEDE